MKKRAFGLVTAIFVMVIVGTIGIYSFYVVAQTARTVVNQDVNMKLKLYENSAEELNLLWLSGNPNRTQKGSELKITFENAYHFHIVNSLITTQEVNASGERQEMKATVLVDIVGRFESNDVNRARTKRTIARP